MVHLCGNCVLTVVSFSTLTVAPLRCFRASKVEPFEPTTRPVFPCSSKRQTCTASPWLPNEAGESVRGLWPLLLACTTVGEMTWMMTSNAFSTCTKLPMIRTKRLSSSSSEQRSEAPVNARICTIIWPVDKLRHRRVRIFRVAKIQKKRKCYCTSSPNDFRVMASA